ncbi:MAG: RagB/SusD family nutrient uptake outer membrane protein [Dysgonamonadaceae bacterium]|jgi:hypothetical protein|nr:RagB/SusD family nutrient uptake outer membrane protein [Dysgonamonadaceae bacterium]
MKLFKNIKTGVAIVVLSLSISACEGWLDPKPMSFYTPENALTTFQGLMTATHMLNRDYRFIEYYPTAFSGVPAFLTEMVFSDLAVNGMTDTNAPPQDLIRQITPSANTDNAANAARMAFYWRVLYKGIGDANTILTRAESVQFDNEEQKRTILAHGRFHRALRYYRLVHQFGDVPFINEEVVTPRFDFYSTQREVILRYLKADLEDSANDMPNVTHRGMVNRGAMYHLLTMINLALGEFDDAIASASRVIDGDTHSLMEHRFGVDSSNPSRNVVWDLHRPENKRLLENREAIYIVLDQFGEEGASNTGMEIMRNTTPWWAAPNQLRTPTGVNAFVDNNEVNNPYLLQIGRGIGTLRGTWYHQRLIWGLDNTDLRRCRESGNWMDMEDLTYNNPALRGTEWYGRNLERGVTLINDTIRNWYGWPNYKLFVGEQRANSWRGGNSDWYIFRLAATYLFRAEAHYWKGNLQLAADDINKVRVRAGARPITANEVDMRMILDERGRELFYEEPRKTELTRISYLYAKTGKPAYTGKSYTLNRFSQENFFFDHIMLVTDFYNQDPLVRTAMGNVYTMAPFHVLWPVPEGAIAANVQGRINQNWGYAGYENNVPPIDSPN